MAISKLIVFLGNPGIEYQLTRHNIAWLVCDKLSFSDKLLWHNKFNGSYCKFINSSNEIFYLLKPMTYMNLSGRSIQALMKFFKINISDVLVVHDEIDFTYGMVQFKKGGGLAGHNGLKSTAELCGSKDFLRFRLGVGRPVHGDIASWVLGKFTGDENICLENYLQECSKAIDEYINLSFEKVLRAYNKKKLCNKIIKK